MATEYRFTVKTDDHRTRYQTAPTFKVVVKRSTARTRYGALAEIYAQAVRMLESNAPVGREATAWIEVYDGKSAPRTLAKFAPLVSTKSGVKSAWLLNEWAPELDGDQWAARVECR
jgi:ribosomal protein L13